MSAARTRPGSSCTRETPRAAAGSPGVVRGQRRRRQREGSAVGVSRWNQRTHQPSARLLREIAFVCGTKLKAQPVLGGTLERRACVL